MSQKRRSIKQRLQRAGSDDLRAHIARDWAANWRADHEATILAAARAYAASDFDGLERGMGQLKALHEKGFDGLATVINALSRTEPA